MGCNRHRPAPSLGGSAWHRCPCRLKKEKEKVSFILEGLFSAFRSSLPNGVAAGSLVLDLKDTNTSLPATLPHPAQGETIRGSEDQMTLVLDFLISENKTL